MAQLVPRFARSDKPKEFWGSIFKMLGYMGVYRRSLVFAIACTLIASVLALIGPQLLSDMTDLLAGAIEQHTAVDMHAVLELGVTIAILYAASFAFDYLAHYIIPVLSERLGNKMRRALAEKIDSIPLTVLDSTTTGDIMSRVSNDCETLSHSSSDFINLAANALFMMFGALIMMFYTDWRLTLIAVLPTLLGVIGLTIVTRRTQKYYKMQTRDLGRMNGLVEEVYYGHDVVRVYNNERLALEQFDDINERLYSSAYKARAISAMMPQIMNFVSNLGYVIVCVAGSIMVLNGSISYGVIVAFIVYIRRFTEPFAQIAEATAMAQSVASATERIAETLEWEDMDPVPDNPDFEFREGRVEFRDVHFSYVPGREVIHGLDLTVEPGSKVAIVGPTGAGKTTIANLLMRFYELNSGEILVDGTPLSTLSRRQIHDLFAMVLQDSWMFSGTLRDNIAFTDTEATDEDIDRVCEAVGIKHYVDSLPDRYMTEIDGANGLSTGQKQQVTIARAILKNAPMIILDEATSSVDTRTEKHIQEAMDSLTSGRTSFVIAHRLSTIVNSDKILVMRDGMIIEAGTHEELLAANGFYKSLYDSQFENCS